MPSGRFHGPGILCFFRSRCQKSPNFSGQRFNPGPVTGGKEQRRQLYTGIAASNSKIVTPRTENLIQGLSLGSYLPQCGDTNRGSGGGSSRKKQSAKPRTKCWQSCHPCSIEYAIQTFHWRISRCKHRCHPALRVRTSPLALAQTWSW
jgi:hypothetical protein